MLITPVVISGMSQYELDDLANGLLLSLSDFAEIACLDGRLTGIETWCETCQDTLNLCVRKEITRLVVTSHEKASRDLGYSLVSRYKTERIKVPRNGVPFTHRLGGSIESVNMVEAFDVVSEENKVNFYSEIETYTENGICFALLPSDDYPNYLDVKIREMASKSVIKQLEMTGYPNLDSDNNWVIPIERCDGGDYIAQHCSEVFVDLDIPNSSSVNVVDIFPVYPNTHQKINCTRKRVLQSDENTTTVRYYFSSWELVMPAFYNSNVTFKAIQFITSPFFKTINFAHFYEQEVKPILYTKGCGGCGDVKVSDDSICVDVLDCEQGIVRITVPKECCDRLVLKCDTQCPVYVDLNYRTGYSCTSNNITNIKEALANYIAAELVTTNCNCEIKTPFIAQAQSEYKDTITTSVAVVIRAKYGERHGHFVYRNKIASEYKVTYSTRI